MPRVAGKVAIVTGGARGIGAALAQLIVEEGAQVIIADVRDEEGAALEKQLGPQCRFYQVDVTDSEAWTHMVGMVEADFGRLDILIANAGIAEESDLFSASDEHYARLVAINQTSTFYGMRAVIPAMRKAGGGAIVNIASVASMIETARGAIYAATKGAVAAMTRAAAIELAPDNIRVNSIHPGLIKTPMLNNVEFLDQALPFIPMRRLGEPREIALLALFLASDEASYCTGGWFVADGGWSAA